MSIRRDYFSKSDRAIYELFNPRHNRKNTDFFKRFEEIFVGLYLAAGTFFVDLFAFPFRYGMHYAGWGVSKTWRWLADSVNSALRRFWNFIRRRSI